MTKPRKSTAEVPQHPQAFASRDAFANSRAEVELAPHCVNRERDETEVSSRAKDQFLAVLSHELRTPLTPIVIALQTLLRRSDLPPAARGALEMIQRNVKIEAHLIDDLLDLTSISYGKFHIESVPIDLHAAINSAVDMCAPEIGAKGQTLAVSLRAPCYRTQGDFGRLRQTVSNLLRNASKFTLDGGDIKVASRGDNDSFLVSVSDTGIGIERNALPNVFDPFREDGERATRKYGGLGLGLAISKATVDAHGGTLTAESAGRGRGATFTVRLPLKHTKPGSTQDGDSIEQESVTQGASAPHPRG